MTKIFPSQNTWPLYIMSNNHNKGTASQSLGKYIIDLLVHSTNPSVCCWCLYASIKTTQHGGKESTRQAGDTGSNPGSGRPPGGEKDNPCSYSYLGNPMDRGTLWAIVHGVTKSQTQFRDKTTNHQLPTTIKTLCWCVDWVPSNFREQRQQSIGCHS